MTELRNVMAYLVTHYPFKHELSKARLTKMIYLADWKSVLDRDRQITDIDWKFNHFGPYVDDVHKVALEDPTFRVVSELNSYGKLKERIVLSDRQVDARVPNDDADILDHVIANTKSLTWEPFIKLVYSTYPVLTGVRGERLNLTKAARSYREIEAQLAD